MIPGSTSKSCFVLFIFVLSAGIAPAGTSRPFFTQNNAVLDCVKLLPASAKHGRGDGEGISLITADGAARNLGWPRGERREHPRSGAATDEQQRGRHKDRPLRYSFRPFRSSYYFAFLFPNRRCGYLSDGFHSRVTIVPDLARVK